jgi:hypothetical protein
MKGAENLGEHDREHADQEYLDILKQMVKEVKYGQIVIVVQDGKVVQIEQNKKVRIK